MPWLAYAVRLCYGIATAAASTAATAAIALLLLLLLIVLARSCLSLCCWCALSMRCVCVCVCVLSTVVYRSPTTNTVCCSLGFVGSSSSSPTAAAAAWSARALCSVQCAVRPAQRAKEYKSEPTNETRAPLSRPAYAGSARAHPPHQDRDCT